MADLDRLNAPFDKVATRPGSGGMVFRYIKPVQVMGRLDEVFGIGGWSCEYRLIHASDTRAVMAARITAPGIQPVEGIGEAFADGASGEMFKAAASDALKRAAVNLGIGRYLYDEWDEARANAPSPNRYSGGDGASAHTVGDVWRDSKGDLRIQCPDHGSWWALTTRDGQAKCKKRIGDNEWCQFTAPLPDDAVTDGGEQRPAQAQPQDMTAMLSRLRQLQSQHGWTDQHLAAAFDVPSITTEMIINAFRSGMTPDELNELALAQMA